MPNLVDSLFTDLNAAREERRRWESIAIILAVHIASDPTTSPDAIEQLRRMRDWVPGDSQYNDAVLMVEDAIARRAELLAKHKAVA